MVNPFRHFAQMLQTNAAASTRSMVVAGALGTIIFGAYGVLWLYVTPLEHESLQLRLLGMLACIALWQSPRWPDRCKKYLPWLWFATLCYALPFFSTYQLLASNYSPLRSMIEVATVFLIIGLFPNYMLASVNMALGLGLGTLVAYFTLPDFWSLNHATVKSVHLPALLYSTVAGMILTRTHLKGLLIQEKVEAMKALIGSIAHEMRGPMGQLSQRMDTIGKRLPDHVVGTQSQTIMVSDLEVVYAEIAKCKEAIERSKQVVEMTMGEINGNPVDRSRYRLLSAAAVVNKAVAEFCFTNAEHKQRVTVTTNTDFVFKGDETRSIFTLFSLLKNATYYFEEYPKARIKITVNSPVVTFEDTGPGVKPKVLSQMFEAFHSIGKPDGTGLGLSFCKRSMRAMGGDITCESVLGEFTRFEMRFPRVAKGEVAAHEKEVKSRARAMFGGKRVLVVDDSRAFRQVPIKLLTELGVVVDEAEDGNQALAKLSAHRYEAMLLDLCMPELDGYATAERVRRGAVPGQENLTIVVHSSESPHAARVRLDRIGVKEFVSKGCPPLQLIEALCRARASSQSQATTMEACATHARKTVLVIEDDDFNRNYVRTTLMTQGFQVLEAPNGQIALSLLNDASTHIDAVITDIHRPHLGGIEIARTLRARPSPRGTMPVIALSARSDEAVMSEAREAGINDFIAKPVHAKKLLESLSLRLDIVIKDVRVKAPVAPQTLPVAQSLIDVARLDSLRRVGLIKSDLAMALEDMRAKFGQLATYVAANDLGRAQTLMHSLMGLAGHLGARAFHDELRSRYAVIVATGQWPPDGEWMRQLRELFTATDRLLQANTGA